MNNRNEKAEKEHKMYATYLLIGLLGIPIGAGVGVLEAFFGEVLEWLSQVRNNSPLYWILLLPIAGLLIVFCYQKFGKNTSKGMGLVFAVGHKEEEVIPWRLIPFSMGSTWITHLFGGSAGREGVAIQIGATFSHGLGRILNIKGTSQIFLVTGMAAGFAGLFQAPIAAVFFAMEVLVAGQLMYAAIFPASVAAVTAWLVSGRLGLTHFSFAVQVQTEKAPLFFLKLVVLGIIFGVVGNLFARILAWGKKFAAAKMPNPYIRIFALGIVLSISLLWLYKGRYSGTGENLIEASFLGENIFVYDWALKFVLTIFTLAIGFQGGEVTPLFAIGATLGAVLASVVGLPIELCAALGFAAVFGSATNTLLCAIFIGAELFGFENSPYFIIVCIVAYICNQNQSIYALQKTNYTFLLAKE